MKISTCKTCGKHFQSLMVVEFCDEHSTQGSDSGDESDQFADEMKQIAEMKKQELASEINKSLAPVKRALSRDDGINSQFLLKHQIRMHKEIKESIIDTCNQYDDIVIKLTIITLFYEWLIEFNENRGSALPVVVCQDSRNFKQQFENAGLSSSDETFPYLLDELFPFIDSILKNNADQCDELLLLSHEKVQSYYDDLFDWLEEKKQKEIKKQQQIAQQKRNFWIKKLTIFGVIVVGFHATPFGAMPAILKVPLFLFILLVVLVN